MNRKLLFILATLAVSGLLLTSCNQIPANDDEQNQEQTDPKTNLQPLKLTVPVTSNWVFEKRPTITIGIENPNDVAVTAEAKVVLKTDMGVPVTTLEKSAEVPAKGKIDINITTDKDLDPSFYNAHCVVNNKTAKDFNFGIDPFQIVSNPDKQPDFDEFWETARKQLPVLDGSTVTMTEITKKSNSSCKVYLVEMQSVPDGLEGEPVVVRGYYLEPQDGKKHPVLMHFFGYDTLKNPGKLSCPSGYGEYAEFYLSHRGQYINNRPASKREDGVEKDF